MSNSSWPGRDAEAPHPGTVCMVLTSTGDSSSNANATGDRMLNLSSAAPSRSRSSACMAGASDIEQLLHGSLRILEHVQAHLQQRRGRRIALRDVGALLDRRHDEPRRAEPHAALKLALALGRRVLAGRRVGVPE